MEEHKQIAVTLDEALEFAKQAHQHGVTDKAKEFYEAILESEPDHPDALHFYGVLQHQLGDSDQALELIDRALSLAPDSPAMFNNKGNVLKELKRFSEAEAAYKRALEFNAEDVGALCNLAAALHAQDQDEQAMAILRKALVLDPEHGESYHNLGNLLREQRQFEEAISCYEKAVEFQAYVQSSGKSARNLAIVLASTGRSLEAEKVLRNWLRQDQNNPIATHLLAALTGENVPARASNDFVVNSFRDYATSFDESLANLKYQAPQLVGNRVAQLLPDARADLEVCDLGCGTGLVAQFLQPYARKLTGVDLSVSMLTQARKRDAYDELVEEELTEYLRGVRQQFDLVTCVDTLCYLGELAEVFDETSTAMRAGGLLCFTVEKMPAGASSSGYLLGPSGRYGHQQGYLEGILGRARFVEIQISEAPLRNEGGKPVAGLVVSARRL